MLIPDPKIVAVLRGISPEEVENVGSLLIESGICTIEVTLNSPSPFHSIELLAKRFGKDAVIGAGTVVQLSQVDDVKSAGGAIIVSPNTSSEIIRKTKQLGMISMPGCFTPSEMFAALESGADALKVFPSEIFSPSAVKAAKAVLPENTTLLVVGGINDTNIEKYLRAGAAGFGVGSSIYKPGKPLQEIGVSARRFVSSFNQALSHEI